MSVSRSWFGSPAAWTVAVALASWACGDGGGGGTTTPTPDPKPVASVTVTPPTASIEVAQTQQVTATLRDAGGNTLTGRSVAWSSSSQAVATVSQAGLVTGSGAGEATITATSEGRSGAATLTVTQPLPPGVLAVGAIGAAGGTVGTVDVGVSIAAGQLSTSTQIEILTYDDPIEEFGADLVTGRFGLRGFPQDREVQVRVRLRTTAPLREQTFIGLGVPVVKSSIDTDEEQLGFLLREAADSAGYLVATMPVRGSGALPAPAALQRVSAAGNEGLLDALLGGVTGVGTDTVPGGQFVIVSWGAPRAELQPMVSRAAKLIGDARVTLEGMNYSLDHRTVWPMEVHVYPDPGAYGAFVRMPPYPLDVDTGWFEFYTWAFSQPDMPGTAIHEFYHFIQARYVEGMLRNQEATYKWVKEAGSTWIEEKAPETVGVFRNSFFQGQRNDLFIGLYPALTANDGYGKAPIMKYVADRWGNDQVRQIFENVRGGTGAIDAVLQAIPEAPATWWPDLLTKYMKGEIISLAADSLPPERAESPLKAGSWVWNAGNDLRPLGTNFLHFTPKPASYGTGTTLTVRIPPALHAAGFRILPFRMDDSGAWEEQGGVVDSLVIEGADLNLGRRYGLFVVHTTPLAPYTQSWSNQYVTDLGYVDGDWYTADVEVVNDAIIYSRPSEGDTTGIDPAENIPGVFGFLAGGGIWKRSATNANHYVWEPTEEFSAQMAALKITASSEVQLFTVDSLRLQAVFDMDPPASPVGESGNPVALGGAGLLLLAGIAMRRRRRMVVVMFTGAFGLALWGCDIGSISFSAKFRYEFKFANPALTASAEDATIPLVQLENGTGTLFVDRYRSEFWEYIRDEEDAIVDSVAVVRTASGQATVNLGAMLFQDGALEEDDVAGLASALLQLPPGALAEAFRGRIRR